MHRAMRIFVVIVYMLAFSAFLIGVVAGLLYLVKRAGIC